MILAMTLRSFAASNIASYKYPEYQIKKGVLGESKGNMCPDIRSLEDMDKLLSRYILHYATLGVNILYQILYDAASHCLHLPFNATFLHL
jgi:hypothetical protein